MKILVTGIAGFIGYYAAKRLLELGHIVIGIDNMNAYYDVGLKEHRLKQLVDNKRLTFFKGDISNKETLDFIFGNFKPEIVLNLAAQAGVRYSITNPESYIKSNIIGFYNILECCRNYSVKHLVYASSSSVYGANKKVPYSVEDKVDNPVSLYAATKKTDELLAYSYSKLYGIPSTGLRFFTVYGPMGRPDMAYFKFTNMLVKGEPIQIYNNGDMFRDFTYVDDIVTGIVNVMQGTPVADSDGVRYKVYNIGNNNPSNLLDFVNVLENCLIAEKIITKVGLKEFLPMQPGDVYRTFADITDLEKDFGFKPQTSLQEGLKRFAKWYKEYYLS